MTKHLFYNAAGELVLYALWAPRSNCGTSMAALLEEANEMTGEDEVVTYRVRRILPSRTLSRTFTRVEGLWVES